MLSSKPRLSKIIFAAILGLLITEISAIAKPEKFKKISVLDANQDMTKIEQLIIKNSNFPASAKIIFPGILIEGNYALAEWQTETMEGTMYLEKNNNNKWSIIGVGFADMNYLQEIGIPTKEAKTLINYMNPEFETDVNLQ